VMDISLWGHKLRPLLSGATPNLVLPMVVYLGIHEDSMARGAALSFGLGWELDILGGGPAFLYRFTLVTVWWLARIASARVSTQSALMRLPLAFASSLVEGSIVLTLLAIFGIDSLRPRELSVLLLPRAITTTLFAPLVFDLAHRLTVENWGAGRSSGSTGRSGGSA
jgi:rod shape-determining protein MreD